MKQLPDFSNDLVLVIGDVMLDQYIYGSVRRISPEAPVPVMLREKTVLKAGGAANVALNIMAMGAQVLLLGITGNDLSGDRLVQVLEEEGITPKYLIRSDSEVTTVKTRLLAGSQHLLRIDEELAVPVDELMEARICTALTDIIDTLPVKAILVEDYNKGLLTPEVIRKITILAAERKIFLAVDPKFDQFLEYQQFDLVKPNLREVSQVLNKPVDVSLECLKEASGSLRSQMGAKRIMITLGDHGIFVDDGREQSIVPANPADIVDVCGAGDAVFSIASLCLLHGMSLEETAHWANKAGSLVCRHPGVVAVGRKELEG